jgi:thiamine-phosphate pyrophosphorylase
MRGYYFITDVGLSRAGVVSDVRQAAAAEVAVVQYRNKQDSTSFLCREGSRLRGICKDIIFLVNDRVDVALSIGADGVHLGQEDMPYHCARRLLGKRRIIGLTVHTLRQAKIAEEWGANYLGVSPVFSTETKPDAGIPVGLELIRRIKKTVSLPIIAIGGIDLSNAASVIDVGADGICAISAVVTRPDVKREIQKFQALFHK